MRIESVRDVNGAALGNHFIVKNVEFAGVRGNAYQATTNVIAFKPYDKSKPFVINRNHGDHTVAIRKYRDQFFEMTRHEFESEREKGHIIEQDLNEWEWY